MSHTVCHIFKGEEKRLEKECSDVKTLKAENVHIIHTLGQGEAGEEFQVTIFCNKH